ncbi:MAG: hypothetical protein LQ352_006312 [Teloschistes flavicans]|nr:MAG: hypothetical protein LQ352_006312 [Teloschistes flavicans]
MIPPAPPGFRADVKFDDRHNVNPAFVYAIALIAAEHWASPSWDSIIRGGDELRLNANVAIRLGNFSPKGSLRLRRGHLMLALHQMVFTVAERNLFLRPYVEIFIENQLLAAIAITLLRNEDMSTKSDSVRDSTNASTALKDDDQGIIRVPRIPWLQVRWESKSTQRIPATDMFTSMMDAMVDTATEPSDQPRASINAVSQSGGCAFNVHRSSVGRRPRRILSNDILRQVLLMLMGEIFIRRRLFAELDIVILGDGIEMGQGFWIRMGNEKVNDINGTAMER